MRPNHFDLSRESIEFTRKPYEPRPTIYSAPRRFDLATILVVTAAYSILLGGLTAVHAPRVVTVIVASFITIVAIAQALLFRGKRPRLASVLIGVIPTLLIVVGLIFNGLDRVPSLQFVFLCFTYPAFGALFGYIAGTLVGSVFMVAHFLRRRLR